MCRLIIGSPNKAQLETLKREDPLLHVLSDVATPGI